MQTQGGRGKHTDTPPGIAGTVQGGEEARIQPLETKTPEFPEARSGPRQGNAVPHTGGQGEGKAGCGKRAGMAAAGTGDGFVGHPGRPAGRVLATGGWTRAGSSRCRGGTAAPDKDPETAAPTRPARPPPLPKRSPPPPQARRERRVPAVEPAAPAPPPAGPLPAQCVGRGEKGGPRWRRAAPTHHDPQRRGDPGGLRCAVQGSQRPSAPRSRRARSTYPRPHPRPARARPPASPPPRARATPARRSELQGRFGRPPLPSPSPRRGLAGPGARRPMEEGRGPARRGPGRPRAPPPGRPAPPAAPRRPLSDGRRFAGPAGPRRVLGLTIAGPPRGPPRGPLSAAPTPSPRLGRLRKLRGPGGCRGPGPCSSCLLGSAFSSTC